MRLRVAAVLAGILVGTILGGIAVLLDAPAHRHDDTWDCDDACEDTLDDGIAFWAAERDQIRALGDAMTNGARVRVIGGMQ